MLAPAAVARAIHVEPLRAVDLLADAVEHVRPYLKQAVYDGRTAPAAVASFGRPQ
jgi:hypothetical protein